MNDEDRDASRELAAQTGGKSVEFMKSDLRDRLKWKITETLIYS